MRIWDIPPSLLCRQHLLGEHRELHAVWSVITKKKKGYSKHPETIRWKGKLKALYIRHNMLIKEMKKRGYEHKSNLPINLARGNRKQTVFINTIKEQIEILKKKNCLCFSLST
jgi:uncharacterized protein (TIGR02328 family)